MARDKHHATASVAQNPDIRFVELQPTDLAAITALEAASWAEPLRASASTLRQRFDLGHIMLGAMVNDELMGLVSFSYTEFSPHDPASLPKLPVSEAAKATSEAKHRSTRTRRSEVPAFSGGDTGRPAREART